ncbi:MAG: hypothetical protein HDR00_02475 [Lachnospiraceae bacterium]|nr:hypothetical protein [Lachnospiraceae bacterium]
MEHKCMICGQSTKYRKPYCCKCYEKIKDNLNIYQRIADEWKLEAKQENSSYFYFVDEANDIINGKKNLVIGRKGEGKTAIAQYLYEQQAYNIFTDKLSFKNFPFNILYALSNSEYTSPNQYISIWKYLIYTTICKQMIGNNNIDSDVVNSLKKIYQGVDSEKKLQRLVQKYTVKEFGIQIAGSGFSVGGDVEGKDITWIDSIDILEDVILQNVDNSKYYIIFDELDEDYKDFKNQEEKENYFDLITGLFKAVQDVKATFSDEKYNIFPVVFLRSDIFNLITYSDKNKWSDSIIRIKWTEEKIKSLITHRLNVVMGTQDIPFQECWKILFGKFEIRVGTRKTKKISTFNYISRSTQNRPRDYIRYFQECSRLALGRHSLIFKPGIIKMADNEFSEYMKSEIVDEIYSVLPEYEEIFAILSQIRKQTFWPTEFASKYDQLVKEAVIPNRDAEKVLKILFDFSVIGNVPSIKNQSIYKYENDSARFNFKERIIIHRGLYKALQIF